MLTFVVPAYETQVVPEDSDLGSHQSQQVLACAGGADADWSEGLRRVRL